MVPRAWADIEPSWCNTGSPRLLADPGVSRPGERDVGVECSLDRASSQWLSLTFAGNALVAISRAFAFWQIQVWLRRPPDEPEGYDCHREEFAATSSLQPTPDRSHSSHKDVPGRRLGSSRSVGGVQRSLESSAQEASCCASSLSPRSLSLSDTHWQSLVQPSLPDWHLRGQVSEGELSRRRNSQSSHAGRRPKARTGKHASPVHTPSTSTSSQPGFAAGAQSFDVDEVARLHAEGTLLRVECCTLAERHWLLCTEVSSAADKLRAYLGDATGDHAGDEQMAKLGAWFFQVVERLKQLSTFVHAPMVQGSGAWVP